MTAWALVAAGGQGTRAGFGYNKAFAPLNGAPVLLRTLQALSASHCFDGIALVLPAGDFERFAELRAGYGGLPLVKLVAEGGATRQASVFNGLRALPPEVDIVAIHDAARPYVSREIIERTITSAEAHGSGVISAPVVDTIRLMDGEETRPLDRGALVAVQTPQTFRTREIIKAHESAARDGFQATDDASVYEKYIRPVRLVTAPGAEDNIKLTRRKDFMQPETARPFRIGTGYDAHRLKEGRDLILCGVHVPYELGLYGHSDADVAVHALMDAMLGALALGDIGAHFPDSAEEYRGISSLELLRRVKDICGQNGWRFSNGDITIVAQRPKLAPYIEQMRENISGALHISIDQISVKATTTERMGFEGEGLGMSAQAVALMEKISY